jgi:hypothetical protein
METPVELDPRLEDDVRRGLEAVTRICLPTAADLTRRARRTLRRRRVLTTAVSLAAVVAVTLPVSLLAPDLLAPDLLDRKVEPARTVPPETLTPMCQHAVDLPNQDPTRALGPKDQVVEVIRCRLERRRTAEGSHVIGQVRYTRNLAAVTTLMRTQAQCTITNVIVVPDRLWVRTAAGEIFRPRLTVNGCRPNVRTVVDALPRYAPTVVVPVTIADDSWLPPANLAPRATS